MELFKRIITTVLAALVLTSCSSMNSAITIGDKEFSTSDVQKPVDEVLRDRKKVDTSQMQLPEADELLRNQAQFYIVGILLDRIAADKKLSVTNADIAARRTEILSQVGGEAELPKALVGASLAQSNLDAYLKILIISEKLSKDIILSGVSSEQAAEEVNKIVVALAKKLGVKVNPKYGKWNPETASIESGDLTDGAVIPAP
jgi:FKBP-type peptidyl-prolyl cis-trans isomerase (trigger factor)